MTNGEKIKEIFGITPGELWYKPYESFFKWCDKNYSERHTLNNKVHLCDSCAHTYPDCPSEHDDVIFGNGIGNDNICACAKYKPRD